MNLPAKPLANANVQRLLKPCTCHESLLDLNLKNQQRLPPESDSDAQESRCEHPAGARCFGSNRIRTTTENTSRFASLIAGICIPGSMADTGDKVNRLSKYPYPKQRTVLLNEQKLLSIDLPRLLGSSSPLINFPQSEVTQYWSSSSTEVTKYRSSSSSAWEICNDKKDFRYRIK